jgi:hypothetical protein
MGVAELLGLEGNSERLDQARRRWPQWRANDHRLAVVQDFDDLSGWLPTVSREDADEVLLALAMLAAPDGGDDLAAAAALAKCLLPGACRLAARLCSLRSRAGLRDNQPAHASVMRRIDELVASQLWIEVRSFPWRRLAKVAANILMNTKAGVLREVGEYIYVSRVDRTWANTSLVDAYIFGDGPPSTATEGLPVQSELLADAADQVTDQSAAAELLEVLTWACENRVISPADRYLLVCLVDEAHRVKTRNTRRGYGGLLSTELSIRVGPRVGASQATVRRRAARTVRTLAAAVAGDRSQPPPGPLGGGGGEPDEQ